MHSAGLFCVLLALAAPVTPSAIANRTCHHDKVKVSVHLETICKDSSNFVLTQLDPVWQELKDIITLDVNTYGKTNYTKEGHGYEFECGRGPLECEGNMLVTCAKRYITQEDQFMTYLKCLFTKFCGGEAGPECAREAGLRHEGLNACSMSVDGQKLYKKEGRKVVALEPCLVRVPHILINGVYTPEAETDLKKYVCEAYEGENKPSACTM